MCSLAGRDYNAVVNASVVLSGQVSAINVPVTIRENNEVEEEKHFTIGLVLLPVEGANILLSPQTAIIRISDNDSNNKYTCHND